MSKNTGTITQIVGVVVDAEFDGNLPAINDALTVKSGDSIVTLEVAQHLTESSVRAIALSSTDGLKRGQEVTAMLKALSELKQRKQHGPPLAVLTAYDYPTARLLDEAA